MQTSQPVFDHLIWGAPVLPPELTTFGHQLGIEPVIGGRHPGIGTHNALLGLELPPGSVACAPSDGLGAYFEILAPDPEQSVLSSFGERLAGLETPRLVGWAVRTDHLESVSACAQAAGMEPGEILAMSRQRPDGSVLSWRLMEIGGHDAGPLIPIVIEWGEIGASHPSCVLPQGYVLRQLKAAHPSPKDATTLLASLGLELEINLGSEPGLHAVIEGPNGTRELH